MKLPEYLNASYEGDDLFTGDQLRAAVLAEREAMMQLFTDPENQPTQHGTVTLEYHLEKIKKWEELFERMSNKVLAQPAPVQERNFCKRCGKRLGSGIHTCTPPAAQRQWVGLDWLPEHKCGLHLSHNEHRDVYETVEQFYDADDFISTEEWHKAVAEDSVWVLHWYPNTPIGFTRIAASTLEAIEAKLKELNT